MATVRDKGFTLVELMIAMVVVAILLMVAAPAFTNMIKDNRLVSEVYALRAALNNARSEAMAQRGFVTVCRSRNGASCDGDWHEGYIAFNDVDGDGVVDAGDGDLVFLSNTLDLPDYLSINFSNAANRVRFDSRGYSLNFGGTFTTCDDRGATKARAVILSGVGAVSAAVDSDDPKDQIVNDHAGVNLVCA